MKIKYFKNNNLAFLFKKEKKLYTENQTVTWDYNLRNMKQNLHLDIIMGNLSHSKLLSLSSIHLLFPRVNRNLKLILNLRKKKIRGANIKYRTSSLFYVLFKFLSKTTNKKKNSFKAKIIPYTKYFLKKKIDLNSRYQQNRIFMFLKEVRNKLV